MKRSTNLVIISGPSGAGEDSVIEGMRKRDINIEHVVTSITRKMRKGETQGKGYYYISDEEFQNLEDNNELVEKAIVYGDQRGVTKKEIQRVQNQKNKIGIWKIDYKGLDTAKKIYPDILSIFITANIDDMIERLKKRGDDEETIKKRTKYTKEFLSHANDYDYTVMNEQEKLDKTIDQVIDILKKEEFI